VIGDLRISGAPAPIRSGIVALIEIAPIFAASSTADTFGSVDASGVGECAASSLLDRTTSTMTLG
jgi:hypothetical protein